MENNSFLSAKGPTRKLQQSRGVTLPIIKLDEVPPSGSPKLIRSGFTRATFGPPTTKYKEDHSPPSTSSPVGYTLRHSTEHSLSQDFNRSTVSESFNIDPNAEEDVLDIRIFFSSGKAVQFSVEHGQAVPSAALLDLMADHLDVDSDVASDAFALWLISPFLEVQLKPHHVAFEVHEKWPVFLRRFTTAQEDEIALDEPLLVLRRNFQLTVQNELKYVEEYERLTEVLYLDAKDQYMTGRYLVDVDVAVELAALQLAIEFGPYSTNEEALDLIHENLGQLVPTQHLSTVRSFHLFGLSMIECKGGLESAMMEEYKTVSKHFPNSNQRRKMFLEILQKTPFYGAAFFTGTKEKKHGLFSSFLRRIAGSSPTTNVLVGINHKFITVIDPSRHELNDSQPINTCCWARSPDPIDEEDIPMFMLQYPDGSTVNKCEKNGKRNGHSMSSISQPNEPVPAAKLNGKNEEIDNGISVILDKSSKTDNGLFVSREIFSKQASMMEALLNSLCADLYSKLNVVQ